MLRHPVHDGRSDLISTDQWGYTMWSSGRKVGYREGWHDGFWRAVLLAVVACIFVSALGVIFPDLAWW